MFSSPPAFLAVDWNGTVVPCFGRPPYPGARKALGGFRDRGGTVVVVSFASQTLIEAEVARVGLGAEEVVGCTDKAEVFSLLHSRLGTGWVLGDQLADLRAARDAALPFLQARLEGQTMFEGAAGTFRSWPEVETLLMGTLGPAFPGV